MIDFKDGLQKRDEFSSPFVNFADDQQLQKMPNIEARRGCESTSDRLNLVIRASLFKQKLERMFHGVVT